MDVAEPFRRRGFRAHLVQELKRIAYELGSVPAACCGPDNVASCKTLQKPDSCPTLTSGRHASRVALRDRLRSGRRCRRAGAPGRPFPPRRHP